MALIGTLRTKMTKWVVGAVALAMGAFIVGSDLFGSGPRSIFGGSSNSVGEIAGNSISLEEYQATVQERENNYILSFGRQPGEREMPTLRQQAWDLLIARKAIVPQYEKVGVEVTSDEVWDMIQGKNVDEGVKSSFVDSAGNFDRTRLIQYLQSVNSMPATSEARVRWDIFKADLVPGRARIKYENLLIKSTYVTEAEAEKDYHTQNDVAEVKFLYVPFFAISDSAVQVSDSDLKAYYDKNKEKFKTQETRNMSYVTFPVTPSSKDTTEIRDEMDRLKKDFMTTSEDSLFAVSNTDGKEAYTKYTPTNLPPLLASIGSLAEGTVLGPFIDNGYYKLVKIVKSGKDTIYNARASHILIRWADASDAAKKVAKEKARKILADIKAGANFADKAREFGTDGTASKGGDLGWFKSGAMVKPFEKAVFDAKKKGVLADVVETDFGYHIIDVTGLKDNTSYTVAVIEREIAPSDETQDEAFRKADNFAGDLSGVKEFTDKAVKSNLLVSEANNVGTSDRRINSLGDARSLVMWLFRDASEGKVSEVTDVDGTYVVAVMTGQTKEGYKSLEQVKEEITPIVRNQQKGKLLIEKVNAQKGTLEEIATAVSPDAQVGNSSDLKLNATALPTAGFDPVAVGKAFSLEAGKRSQPFAGENGVLVLEVQNKTVAPATGDYSIFKSQLKQALDARAGMNIMEAIKEGSKIKDTRYKFY
jgi:peptidyl-prolyl cis-trans isomerase D